MSYSLSTFEVSNSSDVISSVIFFLLVTAFFFIATSSLTYGFFVTSASSLLNGIFISSGDSIGGLCASVSLPPFGGRLSILTSSLVNGTSTVLVSLTGFFVIVSWLSWDFLDISNLSSVNGICSSSISVYVSWLVDVVSSILSESQIVGGSRWNWSNSCLENLNLNTSPS